jgi:peptidoglycan/LPS O-acetylase OafA/YrhL
MVIASHVPEVVDGNTSRELLTRTFGSMTFGELAVDCFFIVSGFLITSSYLNSSTIRSYLIKRVARIYPAFIFASLVCVFIIAPLGGADLQTVSWKFYLEAIGHTLTLNPPPDPGAFAGGHYDGLNNSMWTIRYEFRCYLLVVLLGLVGLLRRPALLGLAAVALLAFYPLAPSDPNVVPAWIHLSFWLGIPAETMKLTGMFLAGATFRGIQNRLPLTVKHMALAAVLLSTSMFVPQIARVGVATAGAYLIFSIAAMGRGTILERINNNDDISYGIYLYAWPLEKLMIWYGFVSPLWLLALCIWVLALALGAFSWFAIEKPVLKFVRKLDPSSNLLQVQLPRISAWANRTARLGRGNGRHDKAVPFAEIDSTISAAGGSGPIAGAQVASAISDILATDNTGPAAHRPFLVGNVTDVSAPPESLGTGIGPDHRTTAI